MYDDKVLWTVGDQSATVGIFAFDRAEEMAAAMEE
jgi:hypothetical protein